MGGVRGAGVRGVVSVGPVREPRVYLLLRGACEGGGRWEGWAGVRGVVAFGLLRYFFIFIIRNFYKYSINFCRKYSKYFCTVPCKSIRSPRIKQKCYVFIGA